MKNYEIGILSFWNAPNYGTFAQAYALQKVLDKISGRDVKQIAHLDQHHYDFYYDKKAYYRSYPMWKKRFWKSFLIDSKDDYCRRDHFIRAYNTIPHTDKIDLKNKDQMKFDKIFLGSDIVWDFTIEPFNRDPMLFGEGICANEINSYAASFGTVNSDMALPEYVVNGIKRMKHISVRDKKSADIIEKITCKRPEIVLDPTWLWDFNMDSAVILPEDEGYILVYGQDFTEDFIKNLVAFSCENNLQIIALDCNQDRYSWCDKLIRQEELNPYLWFGYFKKATIVATSTFHGLTFGLIFKKKIAFCKTDFIISKVGGMLKDINLFELFEDSSDVNRMLSYEWDYKQMDEYIERERRKSLDFLINACD